MSLNRDYHLEVPKEFDYQQNIDYLLRESNEVMYQIVEEQIIRVVEIDFLAVLVKISYKPRCLIVSVLNEVELNDFQGQQLVAYVRDFFDLSCDLAPFYQLAQKDPILKGVEEQFYGLRLMGVPDFFEAISWGILGQQITLGFAYTLKRRLVEKFGKKLVYQNQDYWAFPTAEVIANADFDELVALKLSRRKCEYLQEVARLIVSGHISKEFYLQLADAKAVEKAMTSIRGIGPWTANYVMMRCFRLGDAFPMADVGLLNALKVVQGLPDKPQQSALLPLKTRWGQWCGYSTFYLWRILY